MQDNIYIFIVNPRRYSVSNIVDCYLIEKNAITIARQINAIKRNFNNEYFLDSWFLCK